MSRPKSRDPYAPRLLCFSAPLGRCSDASRLWVPALRPGHQTEEVPAYYVYILASRRYGTLYVGMTIDLSRRMEQHIAGAVPGFTKTYNVKRLVYYEVHDDLASARERERRLKRWRRDWKITLIEERNLDWSDLTPTLI